MYTVFTIRCRNSKVFSHGALILGADAAATGRLRCRKIDQQCLPAGTGIYKPLILLDSCIYGVADWGFSEVLQEDPSVKDP